MSRLVSGPPSGRRTIDGVETMCCFASRYPRADADTAEAVMDATPADWHAPTLHENALRTFRW
jgi:hypothetical protein